MRSRREEGRQGRRGRLAGGEGRRVEGAFVGELKSLEVILFGNDERIYNTLDFLIKGCPHLPVVKLSRFIRVQI